MKLLRVVSGNASPHSPLGKSPVVPWTGNRVTTLLFPSCMSVCPGAMKTHVHTRSHQLTFKTAPFETSKTWVPTSSSAEEWINRECVREVESYSVIISRTRYMRTHSMIWMNPKSVPPGKRRETRNATYCMITFKRNVREGDSAEAGGARGVAGRWRREP